MKKEKIQKPSIRPYLAKYKWIIALYIFLTIFAGGGDVLNSIFLAKAVEDIALPITSHTQAMIYLGIVIGINLIQRGCWFTLHHIYLKYSSKFMTDLNLDLAKQAFKLNSKTYNDHDTGTFVLRIVEDPARIIDCMASIVDIVMDMISAAVIVVYIATLNIWISLALVLLIFIGFWLEFFRGKFRRKNRSDMRRKHDMINSLTTEIVRSEKDIKSLGLEEKLSEVSRENYNTYRKARYKFDMTDLKFWWSRNFILNIGILATLVLGVWLMDLGTLTLATFMIVYSNKGALFSLIHGGGQIINFMVDIRVSHSRMFALFDEKEFISEKFGEASLDNVIGEVEFKDVSFTYKEYEYSEPSKENHYQRQQKLVSENNIFKNLSFKIQPNTTVAFVGKSGSGKSTILNIMSKMYEVDSGQVLIDGIDIKTLNKESLRNAISLVNQFPYIFDMTICENLLLAKGDATEEEINTAIEQASLSEFISTLPKGLESRVGESGIKLSGGQKQRLAIARALLRNSSIIIFDESTSSLDNFAQEEVKKSIDGLKGKSTIVIVAHRLSTIKNVDHIYFLDEGNIVDEGSFEALFKRNEKFKAMFLAENI